MSAVWMTTPRWSVSHLVLEGRARYIGASTVLYGVTACGRHVNADKLLPEPTGIDTIDRCGRCLTKAAELGADDTP